MVSSPVINTWIGRSTLAWPEKVQWGRLWEADRRPRSFSLNCCEELRLGRGTFSSPGSLLIAFFSRPLAFPTLPLTISPRCIQSKLCCGVSWLTHVAQLIVFLYWFVITGWVHRRTCGSCVSLGWTLGHWFGCLHSSECLDWSLGSSLCSSFLLMCTMGDGGWWPECQGSCHPAGRPGLSSTPGFGFSQGLLPALGEWTSIWACSHSLSLSLPLPPPPSLPPSPLPSHKHFFKWVFSVGGFVCLCPSPCRRVEGPLVDWTPGAFHSCCLLPLAHDLGDLKYPCRECPWLVHCAVETRDSSDSRALSDTSGPWWLGTSVQGPLWLGALESGLCTQWGAPAREWPLGNQIWGSDSPAWVNLFSPTLRREWPDLAERSSRPLAGRQLLVWLCAVCSFP